MQNRVRYRWSTRGSGQGPKNSEREDRTDLPIVGRFWVTSAIDSPTDLLVSGPLYPSPTAPPSLDTAPSYWLVAAYLSASALPREETRTDSPGMAAGFMHPSLSLPEPMAPTGPALHLPRNTDPAPHTAHHDGWKYLGHLSLPQILSEND